MADVRGKIRGCPGPPIRSMALRKLRRSLPRRGVGHSVQLKRHAKSAAAQVGSERPSKIMGTRLSIIIVWLLEERGPALEIKTVYVAPVSIKKWIFLPVTSRTTQGSW